MRAAAARRGRRRCRGALGHACRERCLGVAHREKADAGLRLVQPPSWRRVLYPKCCSHQAFVRDSPACECRERGATSIDELADDRTQHQNAGHGGSRGGRTAYTSKPQRAAQALVAPRRPPWRWWDWRARGCDARRPRRHRARDRYPGAVSRGRRAGDRLRPAASCLGRGRAHRSQEAIAGGAVGGRERPVRGEIPDGAPRLADGGRERARAPRTTSRTAHARSARDTTRS
jgi:hypothetical protein